MQKLKYQPKEWDYSFSSMDWWNRDAIRQAKVMVVGCGALGNEVIKNLVLLHIGHITIVDFDKVEFKNLSRSIFYNRQHANKGEYKTDAIYKKMKDVNPEVSITAINGDIRYDVGLSYFAESDVIISCVDNRIARLFISRHAYLFGTPWIDGAIQNISGSLQVYKKKDNCYECNLTSLEWDQIRAKLSCADVEHSHHELGSIATTSISSSIIGALQVQEALKIIHQFEDKTMTHSLYYEGLSNTFLQINNDSSHGECSCKCPNISYNLSDLSSSNTMLDVFNFLSRELAEPDATILLRNSLVLEYSNDDNVVKGLIPKSKLKFLPGNEKQIIKQVDMIERSFNYMEYTLSELGIADRDILKVICQDSSVKYLQLK